MPANRHGRPHEEKAAEILAVAQRLFLERGYGGTTMAAIATDAGVASNVVHWYFASKDELFARALEGLLTLTLETLLEQGLDEATPGEEKGQLEVLLTDLIWRLEQVHGLIASVHERANHSEVVAAFHERAHGLYSDYLGRAVARCDVPERDHDLVVQALLMAFEALVMHRAPKLEAQRMIAFLVTRLTANP